jgi:hypothetical protein
MQALYRDRSVAYSKFICGDMSGKGKRGNRVKEIPSTPSSNPQVTVNGILQGFPSYFPSQTSSFHSTSSGRFIAKE